MCGVCGFFSRDLTEGEAGERLEKMLAVQSHRGPDADGSVVRLLQGDAFSSVAALGHCRLSIIDLSSDASQPLLNEDESLALVVNGEIYNFQELRRQLEAKGHRFRSGSDSEVILHLYEEEGVDFPSFLEGMFAGALLDVNRGVIHLFRDRFGKKPLFFHHDEQSRQFSFASTFSSLSVSGLFKCEPDLSFLPAYFTLGYIPQPLSAYKGVQKLKPAHIVSFYPDGSRTERCYWRLEDALRRNEEGGKFSGADLLELLRSSVLKRLVSDVPLGVFLSGGIDSSMIAALATERLGEGIKSFSVGFDDDAYNELPFAEVVAKHLRCEHHAVRLECKASEVIEGIIGETGEPYGDPSIIPSWYVSKMTKERVSVALTGDGGDELFAGYDRYRALQLHKRYCFPALSPLCSFLARLLPCTGGKKSVSARGRRFLEGLSQEWLDAYIGWNGICDKEQRGALLVEKSLREPSVHALFRAALSGLPEGVERENKAIFLDYRYYLTGDLLPKVDYSSMLHSLECRSPFLDHQLVERVFPLSIGEKMKGGEQKGILKELAREYLPPEIIHRKKAGFGVPLHRWMRGELQERMRKALCSGQLASVLNMQEAERMNREHCEGKSDYAYPLYLIMVLDLWFKGF